ncbi:putative protein [BD1-7 clade bacterium]|uniref:Outer membrane lipoprotein-sorting protein n=1 Tax=BD1-7 clade bacterium TaxID=2029982 RepID=A0A5S9Q331_9GAMM|nr:putative protein [BD1-7 clade bacterium]CAA0112035.1 putative protein [BD1-7 clade bacterium]
MKSILKHSLLAATLAVTPLISVAATSADQAKLGTELTPMGANPKANADGSIPAWGGTTVGLPEGLAYEPGKAYPDPYANEKPLFVITAAELDKYRDKLTNGTIALFEKYPDSFTVPVYKTHRDFRYKSDIEERTKWNVGHAKLVNIDGLQQYTGGAPFPIPENGAEVIWNARFNQPMAVADATYDEIAVYNKGSQQRHRTELLIETPLAYGTHPVGKVSEDIDINAAYVFHRVLEPKRKKGEMVVVHEPVDQLTHKRKAWVYIPGAKRVKRAPDVGYDTPVGPGGLMTADDGMGFNGGMDRYNWKLIGKKEIYVPYHNYKFDSADIDYATLLPGKHVNADYMRYELHRVWIVEATLKDGQRHIYAKRRFYMPEDSWLVASYEMYDGRGDLYRIGFMNSVYDFYLKGYVPRAQVNYDLQEGAYVAVRLVNETRPVNFAMEPKGKDFFSPNQLRKMGRR